MLDTVLYARDKWLDDRSRGEQARARVARPGLGGWLSSLCVPLQCFPTPAASVSLLWATSLSGTLESDIGTTCMVSKLVGQPRPLN